MNSNNMNMNFMRNIPRGLRLSAVLQFSCELLLNGTLNDFPCTAVLPLQSELRADKWRAACSDSLSVTDFCGPPPRSG